MEKQISIYQRHINEDNWELGQNGFDLLSGSAWISQSNAKNIWYVIYAVGPCTLAAQSAIGSDLSFSGSFASQSAAKTISLIAGQQITGIFTQISQSAGLSLAYRG